MNTLLVTENIRKTTFLKKSFLYENLHVEEMPYENFLSILNFALNNSSFNEINNFARYKGIIFEISSFEILKNFIECLDRYEQRKIIFVLNTEFSLQISSLKSNFSRIFYVNHPYNFNLISIKLKSEAFNLDNELPIKSISYREIKFDLEKHEVFFKENKLHLRNKEFELLYFFLENKGKLLTRSRILEQVWDMNANLFTNTLEVHISRLRRILKSDKNSDSYIQTVPCTGYIFL